MEPGERVSPERERARWLDRYVRAADRGDLDGLAAALAAAAADPELDRQIASVDAALYEEAGLSTLADDARRVRRLLLQHLPSGAPGHAPEPAPAEEPPLTVADVARRLEAGATGVPPLAATDRLANRRLLDSAEPLPRPVTGPAVQRLADRLDVGASARYWDAFRSTALRLAMARERDRVELQAARRRETRRAQPADGNGPGTPGGERRP